MTPEGLTGARVVVLGLGVDNLAALPTVVAAEPARLVAAVDAPDAVSVEDRAVADAAAVEVLGSDQVVDWLAASGGRAPGSRADAPLVVVRAPGYPRRGALAGELESIGASFTTAVDLWMGAHGAERPVIGITGTKGKSTVTALLDELLTVMGVDHVVGGNIGLPIWAQAADPPPGVPAVIEVSSYMAADAHHPPTIGVLTSLDADHLTWHGSVEAYRRDKLHLFTGGTPAPNVVLAPAGDVVARGALEATGLAVEAVHPEAARFVAPVRRLVERGQPAHQGTNLALAAVAADRLCELLRRPGPAAEQLLALAERFEGLPSRHSTISHRGEVRWIDDALASNPFAAAAALDSVGAAPVAWLIGGQSREVALDPMCDALRRRSDAPTLLIGLPDTGPTWCRELVARCHPGGEEPAGIVASRVAASLAEAVGLAADELPAGGVVLFAPGAPTPPRLGTYQDRAAAFADAIGALG
ncbi:MAG: Mur ligase family protein [Microthrixaceae bacterium]